MIYLVALFSPAFVLGDVLNISTFKNDIIKLDSISGKFEQETYDSVQDKKTYSSGSFAFKRPELMKWEYLKPEPLSIFIGKTDMWIYDPILETVSTKKVSQLSGFDSLNFIIEPEKIDKSFRQISPSKRFLDAQNTDPVLFLAPVYNNANYAELQLLFGKKNYLIKQFVIIDRNGSYRKITLSDVLRNPKLSDSDFEFKIPEGTEIIDQSD